MKCLRCQALLRYMGTEKLQLGQTGFLLGSLPNLFAGSLTVQIYVCKNCGKMEFFCDSTD